MSNPLQQPTLRSCLTGLATFICSTLAAPHAAAQTFVDVTGSSGISHVHANPSTTDLLPGPAFMTGGVAAADFDLDGHTDLLFTRLDDVDLLYRNRGNGTFEPRTASAGFSVPTRTNGIAVGDVDNDGDPDVYMTTNAASRNYLYLNDGNGFFTDAGPTRTAALANGVVRNGQSATFGDYDNDGYLDLMTCDWGNVVADSQSRLLRNLGASQPGYFEDVTVAAGLDVYRDTHTYRFTPRFVDLDRDGRLDLAIAADFRTSQLFWNNGDGTFTDGTIPAGVGTDNNGMGSTFGDYDGDGDLDWFITNITADPNAPGAFGGWNRLYRYDGNRQFTDVTLPAGVRDSRWSWGTTFFDYDNDGDLDLIATNGYTGAGWLHDRTFLWRNDNGVYTDVSDAAGITDTQQGRGLVHLDYDSDGDLDLVIVNNGAAPILYRNDGGNAHDCLRITLEGTTSNRDGVGARITVTPDLAIPTRKMVWEVDGGSSFLSYNERTAHFGLGPSDGTVDLVMIRWPRGLTTQYTGLAANQTVHFVEPPLLGDFDADGDVDATDFTNLQACLADALVTTAATSRSGCTDFDFDTDGAITLADIARFQSSFTSSP